MRYYKLRDRSTERLVAADETRAYDLTAARSELQSFRDLAKAASVAESTVDEIAERHLDPANEITHSHLSDAQGLPATPDEVWAAGVTYRISEEARKDESDTPEMYLDVYDADRPEIFFKATPSRTVGPDDTVGIRADSNWNVPEPELGIVLYRGETVGYTVGNDMSSRSIEGENPLYLPQAKVYEKCCSLGPCVRTDIDDPNNLGITMTIHRDGDRVYSDQTSTAKMVRGYDELVSYFTAHNSVPELTVLLTGTSLVPDEEFTLREGDRVDIDIENIGVLSNPITEV
ncbi:MAG: fumarylacetoacetate hydrolase family protein [Haloarcula sp.]